MAMDEAQSAATQIAFLIVLIVSLPWSGQGSPAYRVENTTGCIGNGRGIATGMPATAKSRRNRIVIETTNACYLPAGS
jgi:hypothetical protein